MSNPLDITPHALAAETSSGSTAALDIGSRNALQVTLDVEVITPDTRISVKVETSTTGTGGWKSLGSLPALSTTTFCEDTFGSVKRFVRFSWTIEGTTPSVTFALTGSAHLTYAVVRDLERLGIAVAALKSVATGTKVEALIAASDTADRYLCRQFTLPLIAWGNDLRRLVAHIATYDLMAVRGFQPEGADQLIVKRYDDAMAALREVGEDKACMPEVEDSDDGDDATGSSDGDYDVASLDTDLAFGTYPYGAELDDSST